jgi:hypothetical protein
MTRAEAKRRLCAGVAALLDDGHENAWLTEGLSDEDGWRMQSALDEFVMELRRRGAGIHTRNDYPRVEPEEDGTRMILAHDEVVAERRATRFECNCDFGGPCPVHGAVYMDQ